MIQRNSEYMGLKTWAGGVVCGLNRMIVLKIFYSSRKDK